MLICPPASSLKTASSKEGQIWTAGKTGWRESNFSQKLSFQGSSDAF